ncbi:MAG: hypothetical protein DWQ04_14265 [Chloroflexi bacterium]|nr:MAG: hypothetical protein DWQ04_14265 [Chloroflexota bacterium]
MKLVLFLRNRRLLALLTTLILTLMLGQMGTHAGATSLTYNCANSSIPEAECETLVTLYNNTDGSNWINNANWNPIKSPCFWYGVYCNNGRVEALSLSDNQLDGTIPDISALSSLIHLDLSSNQLSGPIPNLSSLSNLVNLQLDDNQLSGTIPNLSNLTSLQTLFLYRNQLSGPTPDISNLTNLQQVLLSYNQLSGTIPNFYGLPNLRSLSINSNQLTGSIPDISTLPNLSRLSLGHNQLSGSIPDFSTSPNLNSLYLSDNQLTGTIPNLSPLPNLLSLGLSKNQLSGLIPDLSTVPNLTFLDLGQNQLTGSIPNLSTLTSLRRIYLNSNQLSGPIPDLNTLTDLETIHFYDNLLSGPIPDFSSLTNLRSVKLDNNQLNGSIPNLSSLSNLLILSLHNNQISGTIPNLSSLTKMSHLYLNNNQLSGPIPDLSALSDLMVLNLSNNQLSGSVPTSICITSYQLDIDYNKLETGTSDSCINSLDTNWKETQTVPPTNVTASSLPNANIYLTWDAINYTQDGGYYGVWGKPQGDAIYSLLATTADKTITNIVLTNLQPGTIYEFVVRTFTPAHGDQQNDLTSVDSEMVTAVTTTTFNCATQIDIPQSECETLVALYNSTDGPNWRDNSDWLATNSPCQWSGVNCSGGRVDSLELDNRRLNGTLPDLAALTNIVTIDLSNNQLSGSLPELSTLIKLAYLLLENNQFSGTIPNLSAPTELRILNLSNNDLTGEIPDLSKLTLLNVLILNTNHLTGPIPDLSNLMNLWHLDLNNNKLDGAIPDFSSNSNLRTIYLANNQFSGSVPTSVCQLQNVYIGYNKLEVNSADSCVDTAAPGWKQTQTVPPTNITITTISATEIELTWDTIEYTDHGGYYGIWGKKQSDAAYTLMATTGDKTVNYATISGLQPETAYEFVIHTFTPAHGNQQNDLTSVESEVVSAITLTDALETYTTFLPIIIAPVQFEPITLNGITIPIRNVTTTGEVFHTATVTVVADLPASGTFYLSSSASAPIAARVDDEIGILLNGVELFTNTYGQPGLGVTPALVEVPRSVMTQIAGKTITVKFRDVYGDNVGATELYLIWTP